MTAPRHLPYGPRALLVEYDTLDEVMAAAAALRRVSVPGVLEVVPAARTVLVVHDGRRTNEALLTLLHDPPPHHPGPTEAVEIEVRYDGDDLDTVAELCALSVEEVVALHSGTEYRVAFCGFMAGFSYLIGLPARLHLPRRSTPRPRVPAGSVAIAGEYTAVYPSASPGGWHLLGRTTATMWDESRPVPALLPPGTSVRFVVS